ncbi:MAG TPA: oligosaccharide flippase family protein [Solirubrobacteraceae bacterium]|nr:oligosaccharide flippase family protein [Solirubrobacteraceae bacterium]
MSAPPQVADTTARASSGAVTLAARYLFVGLLNLGATTLLVRHLGPAAWASYGVALFLANFIDQYLGSKLLAAVVASREPSRGLLRSSAYLMQIVGRLALLIAIIAMLPVSKLTALHSPLAMCAASGICGYVYVSRALPSALMERRLEYRLIGAGEVLDQITFTVLAVALVLGGLGLAGVMLALAVQGLPTLVLWRRHTHPTPFLGHRGKALAAILGYAVPGSGVAVCVLVEGAVPMVAFSFAHARLLGLAITSSSILSYPGVAVLVLQRISFPAFARAAHPERLNRALNEVSAAAAAILIGAEGLAGITCPWWLPWLFGSRWHGAWPLTACYAACYVLLGQINVLTGALYAAGRPLGALLTWAWMAVPWVLGAALWMLFGRPVWLVAVLLAARVLGLLAGRLQLRRAGLSARVDRALIKCALAAAATVGGASAVATHRSALIVVALVVLAVVEAVALWDARVPLRALCASVLKRGAVELAH